MQRNILHCRTIFLKCCDLHSFKKAQIFVVGKSWILVEEKINSLFGRLMTAVAWFMTELEVGISIEVCANVAKDCQLFPDKL
jgi:hypothetical protein